MNPRRTLIDIASYTIPSVIKRRLRVYTSSQADRISKILYQIDGGDDVLDIGSIQHSLEKHNWNWQDPEPGKFLFADLHRVARRVVGVDIVERDVKAMKEAGFDVRLADAHTLDLNEKFDVVVAGEVIEHLENPGQFLNRCRQHLKPEGRIIITTPNPRRLQMLLWFLIGKDEPGNPEHTMWFDWFVMRELARRCKLEVESWDYYCPGLMPVSLPLYRLGIARDLTAGGWIFKLKHIDN